MMMCRNERNVRVRFAPSVSQQMHHVLEALQYNIPALLHISAETQEYEALAVERRTTKVDAIFVNPYQVGI